MVPHFDFYVNGGIIEKYMKKIINRDELLKIFPKNMVCAEIGVLAGDYSKKIQSILEPKELHLIDHFSGKLISGDHNGQNVKAYDLDQEYLNLKEYFKNIPSIILKKGFSYDLLPEYSNDYFDFVYIDSDHTYEGTWRELELCFLKVKNGGYISGHDYSEEHFPECKKAIDEFCVKYHQEISWVTIEDRMASFVIQLSKEKQNSDQLIDVVLSSGFSMLSRARLENLKKQIDYIIDNSIPGDFVETGTANGGSIIFMKKYLEFLGVSRTIHACDSFQGMPPASDIDLDHTGEHPDKQDHSVVNVSKEKFLHNLRQFNIFEQDIVIHQGWFEDTLPHIHTPIALLRMDGDWYSSTMTTFENLYDLVVPGGIILVDDYGWWQGCKKAVHDFFKKRNIPEGVITKTENDGTEIWFVK
jgi:O-methyltransferase